jgi:hypothetical protein
LRTHACALAHVWIVDGNVRWLVSFGCECAAAENQLGTLVSGGACVPNDESASHVLGRRRTRAVLCGGGESADKDVFLKENESMGKKAGPVRGNVVAMNQKVNTPLYKYLSKPFLEHGQWRFKTHAEKQTQTHGQTNRLPRRGWN